MKYKAEILYKRRIIAETYADDLSHPNQIVTTLLKKLKVKPPVFIIFVVNEVGDLWKYSATTRKDGKIFIKKMVKKDIIINKNDIDMIFSGNADIYSGKW